MTLIKMTKRVLVFSVASLLVAAGTPAAQADWGSWGGSHGYSSHGSWGGSRGGLFNGSRGGPIRNLFSRIRSHHSSGGGSWGSHGSHGSYGSTGSYASRGYGSRGYGSSGHSSRGYAYYSPSSGGSRGYYGSSGHSSVGSGVIYSTPGYGAPVYPPSVIPYTDPNLDPGTIPQSGEGAPADGTTPPPGPRTGTENQGAPGDDSAILRVRLPAEAVVYVNGKRTRTPGDLRSYVSRNLVAGKRYSYEIRAEIERNGETLARTKVVQLTAGNSKTIDFSFDADEQILTSLTLLVPEDARVTLGGVETKATGPLRYFSTSSLKDGEKWDNYTVAVTVERDGQEVTQEKVVDLGAGASLRLDFDFDSDARIAAN